MPKTTANKTKQLQTNKSQKKKDRGDEEFLPEISDSELDEMIEKIQSKLTKPTVPAKSTKRINVQEFQDLEAEEAPKAKKLRVEPIVSDTSRKIWTPAESALLSCLVTGRAPIGRNPHGTFINYFYNFS